MDELKRSRRGGATACGPLWFWNGALCPEDTVRVHPRDRGFLYGDGVYETLRIHHGQPFRLEEHLARMGRGLEVLAIPIEPAQAFPRPLVTELIQANVGTGEGRLRLQITRGIEGISGLTPDSTSPTVLAAAEPLPAGTPTSLREAVRLATVDTIEARRPGWSSLKSLSYVAYVLAASEARARGGDDALLVHDGRILESTAANVFVVCGQRLLTPARELGLLAGVTRDLLLELAGRRGLDVREAVIDQAMVANADEMFLTGSVRGVRAVAVVDEQPLAVDAPGPLTSMLRDDYDELVEESCPPRRMVRNR